MKIPCFLLIFLSTHYLYGQNNLGARLSALADNGASVNDIWTLQSNPAGITFLDKPAISLSYIKNLLSNEISSQSVVGVIPFKNNFIGASFQRYGFSAYNESKIGFAYAKKFGESLSLALNTNYHQLKIANYGATTGFSVDIGVLYHLNGHFVIGAFTSNLSRQKFNTDLISANIASSFNVVASYVATNKVLIATTVSKITNQSMDIRWGIEYKLFDLLSLRGGIGTKPFKQHVGFGLAFKKFLMDMATSYDANLGYAPQIALGYAL